MRNKEPGFWHYTVAYILFGCGTILIVGELLEFAFADKRANLVPGLLACFLGFLLLNAAKRRGGPAEPDAPADGGRDPGSS